MSFLSINNILHLIRILTFMLLHITRPFASRNYIFSNFNSVIINVIKFQVSRIEFLDYVLYIFIILPFDRQTTL